MRLLGTHISTSGGVDKSIERGEALGCTAIQIFVKNNNQWFGKPQTEEEINLFLKAQKQSGIFVFAHAGYLINIASPDPELQDKSLKSLIDELARCEALALPFIALHPGSHLQQGEEEGIKKAVKTLDTAFKETKGFKVKILIETTAGQGTNLGYKFEHLAEILNLSKYPKRLGVCFDTCHAFAAGYDIKTKEGYESTWKDFDRIIGIKNLMAFHLNDSKGELGSHKDRHEHIGKGTLGKEVFTMLLNDPRFKDLPMVLETPKDKEMLWDKMNLATLNNLIK
ncbi:MAG: deoxyribonuclease IV [Candidatus Saganbacteria bacterium]|nr:deoxyribonuclease IV [Candidatus Saganbacteria bacterium]